MNTANQVDLLVAQLTAEGRTKADIVWQTALACVGWPYVFGRLAVCVRDVGGVLHAERAP